VKAVGKKIAEVAFIGAASYISGLLYEQGRAAGKTVKISPKAFAESVGGAQARKLISDLIEKAKQN
jgi:hypothetical protein